VVRGIGVSGVSDVGLVTLIGLSGFAVRVSCLCAPAAGTGQIKVGGAGR
jgi:hypothetical protein